MGKLKQMLILSKTLYFDTTEILVYDRDHVPNILRKFLSYCSCCLMYFQPFKNISFGNTDNWQVRPFPLCGLSFA